MKIVKTLRASDIRKFYSKIDIDVERLVASTNRFELVEEDSGLLKWYPAIPGDSKFYEQLSRFSWYYSQNKDEFQFVNPWVDNKVILEVGCGFGFFADNIEYKQYHGLELNEDAAEVARAKGHQIECMSIGDYANNKQEIFDIVCSFQVLEHFEDPSEYFKSAYKLLKPGGLLITSVPSEDSFVGTLNPKDNIFNAPPHHLTRWTDKALCTYAQSFGYEGCELHHLPVEKQHHKWFIASLLSSGIKSQNNSYAGKLVLKMKMRVIMGVLRMLGSDFSVPSKYSIPGHTVVSIHKKPFI